MLDEVDLINDHLDSRWAKFFSGEVKTTYSGWYSQSL